MAERAIQAANRPQPMPRRPTRIQQERRAARDVPLCVPQLRVAWICFGVGIFLVLLSLCLMIAGAASSSTVYGGKGSPNLTTVYVGIVFLIPGLAALGYYGFLFARVRRVQKAEYIRKDCGHDNAAFPVTGEDDVYPMTNIQPKYSTPALPDSPNDSAYSSFALASHPGSELSARRLSEANSEKPLISNTSVHRGRGYPQEHKYSPSGRHVRPNYSQMRADKPSNNSHVKPYIDDIPSHSNSHNPEQSGAMSSSHHPPQVRPMPSSHYPPQARPMPSSHYPLQARPMPSLNYPEQSRAMPSSHYPGQSQAMASSRSTVVRVERHGPPPQGPAMHKQTVNQRNYPSIADAGNTDVIHSPNDIRNTRAQPSASLDTII